MPLFRLNTHHHPAALGAAFDAHTPLELFAGLMGSLEDFLPGEWPELEVWGWTEEWDDATGGYVPAGPEWVGVAPSALWPLPAGPDAIEQAVAEAWPFLLDAAWPDADGCTEEDWDGVPF